MICKFISTSLFVVVQARQRNDGMAGNVQKGFPNTIVLLQPSESPHLFANSGNLITNWVDSIVGYSEGVLQGAFRAAVVTPLPGQEAVQLVAQRAVRITRRFLGRL
jgi:hypothetical protein